MEYVRDFYEDPNLEEITGVLSCSIGLFPTTYVGLPLGAKLKSNGIWNAIIEKLEKRLANWQIQYLSMSGRLTLINSVLNNMLTHYMTLFPIHNSVLKLENLEGKSCGKKQPETQISLGDGTKVLNLNHKVA